MEKIKKDKRGTQRWEWFIDDTIQSLLSGLAALVQRVLSLEAYIGTGENIGQFLFGLPEFANSFEAIQGGLDYHDIYRNGNVLKTVGSELAVTLIPFKATTAIEIASPDIYLIDPYTRGVYAENGLVLAHTGLAGDAKLLTTPEEPITITSSDIEGWVNTSSTGALTILGAPAIVGLYAPSANIVSVNGCESLEDLNAISATYVDAIGCAALTSVICPNATDINLSGCALTAQAIEDLLMSLETTGNENGVIDISGGTSETLANWSNLAQSAIQNLEGLLGWTVTFNGQV